jgi:hypothetical protein
MFDLQCFGRFFHALICGIFGELGPFMIFLKLFKLTYMNRLAAFVSGNRRIGYSIEYRPADWVEVEAIKDQDRVVSKSISSN